jgi:hypothetical protein
MHLCAFAFAYVSGVKPVKSAWRSVVGSLQFCGRRRNLICATIPAPVFILGRRHILYATVLVNLAQGFSEPFAVVGS